MHTTVFLEKDPIQQEQLFSDWWNNYYEFEGEPTTIQVHKLHHYYGGPEEGGWYYVAGEPVETHCIFSKEQAIKRLIELHERYAEDDYSHEEFDIRLGQSYAEIYPSSRPHYE